MDHLSPCPANSPPLTPLIFLERAATVYGDTPSIFYDNNISFTWSQTYCRSLLIASSLSSLGIQRGHVVSILSPNTPAMYELQFAVPMSGAILNNINIRLDPRTLSLLLHHSESKLLFVDVQSISLTLNALSLFPKNSKTPLLILIADDTVAPLQNPPPALDFVDTYEGLVAKGDPSFKWVRPNSEWDPITLNYTSGTTSAPKGVVHSHRGTFIMSLDSLINWSVQNQPVYLWTLPIFHSNGWSFPWGMAAVGGVNVCTRRIDAPTIYHAIDTHGVTHLCAAPVVLNMLVNHNRNKALKNPVHILTGGSPPPAVVLSKTEAIGFVVTHGYGMTEVCGVVISCAWKNKWNKFPLTERAKLKARQGVRTVAMTEVDVVDGVTGASVKHDGLTAGEIVVRGACVMLGYLKDQKATLSCMQENGWLYTGDIGVIHEDGYLEIKDRSKDVIITGGENVSSVEVEAVLYTHPAVSDVAVVARPDDFWGETPCAFVALKSGLEKKPTEKQIMEFCRESLPHFMVPKTVVFLEELPRTSTGKVQKYVLRKDAQAMGPIAARASRM